MRAQPPPMWDDAAIRRNLAAAARQRASDYRWTVILVAAALAGVALILAGWLG
jgi:hypothetical protein